MKRANRDPFMFQEYKLALGLCTSFGQACEPGCIAFAIGAGGCGKTSIAKHLAKTIFGPPKNWSLGSKPVLLVQADLVDRAYFTTKSLMRSFICSVYDPFRSSLPAILNWDIEADLKKQLYDALTGCDPYEDSEPNMRPAFIEIAKLVGVKLIIVDEANLLVLIQRGRIPTDYLESLRLLADQIGCCILLVGTLDMLELMEYSAPLNRRGLDIHIDRMRCDSEEGKLELKSFLGHMEEEYGLEPGVLMNHVSEVYAATYGIPGEIVGLIDRSEHFKNALDAPCINWPLIQRAMHHPSKIARLQEEADLIYRIINGKPLTSEERIAITKRRRNRTKPQRRKVAEAT